MKTCTTTALRQTGAWRRAGRRWVSDSSPSGEPNTPKGRIQDHGHDKAVIIQSAMCKTRVKHRPHPTLFFFPGLTARAVWDHPNAPNEPSTPATSFPWLDAFRDPGNVDAMRQEYIALTTEHGVPSDYSTKDATRPSGEHKMHQGDWSWHSFISKGRKNDAFERLCPVTASLLNQEVGNDLMLGLPFAFAFYSTLHAGSSIAPHHAPCNLRLRVHVPLVVPGKLADEAGEAERVHSCGMRVADELREWRVGEPILFDDSYEHEVWNRTAEDRVVLLFDVWHPDLAMAERLAIADMFSQQQGP